MKSRPGNIYKNTQRNVGVNRFTMDTVVKQHTPELVIKEPIQEREITNTRYKGKVHLYRKEFLEEYFRLKKEADYEPSIGDRQDYQL